MQERKKLFYTIFNFLSSKNQTSNLENLPKENTECKRKYKKKRWHIAGFEFLDTMPLSQLYAEIILSV